MLAKTRFPVVSLLLISSLIPTILSLSPNHKGLRERGPSPLFWGNRPFQLEGAVRPGLFSKRGQPLPDDVVLYVKEIPLEKPPKQVVALQEETGPSSISAPDTEIQHFLAQPEYEIRRNEREDSRRKPKNVAERDKVCEETWIIFGQKCVPISCLRKGSLQDFGADCTCFLPYLGCSFLSKIY